MTMPGILYCALATATVVAGDYFIKLSTDRGASLVSGVFLTGCALYAISAIGWFLTLRHMSVSQMGIGSSVFTLLALCALGVVVFGEDLRQRDLLGITMAVGAIVLMHRG